MTKIKYLKGDATNPQGEGNKLIAHICNNKGKWGAGFVLALSKKWSGPEFMYHNTSNLKLGTVRYVFVEEGIAVANMIAQHDTKPDKNGVPPIRYNALKKTLINVNDFCKEMGFTLHMPKIGAGLAGGNWTVIEKIIEDNVQVPVIVYEFE